MKKDRVRINIGVLVQKIFAQHKPENYYNGQNLSIVDRHNQHRFIKALLALKCKKV